MKVSFILIAPLAPEERQTSSMAKYNQPPHFLQAAARAAEMAMSTGTEEATSTHTDSAGAWLAPSPLTITSHLEYKPHPHQAPNGKQWPLVPTPKHYTRSMGESISQAVLLIRLLCSVLLDQASLRVPQVSDRQSA